MTTHTPNQPQPDECHAAFDEFVSNKPWFIPTTQRDYEMFYAGRTTAPVPRVSLAGIWKVFNKATGCGLPTDYVEQYQKVGITAILNALQERGVIFHVTE